MPTLTDEDTLSLLLLWLLSYVVLVCSDATASTIAPPPPDDRLIEALVDVLAVELAPDATAVVVV